MSSNRILGLILLVVGLFLLYFGLHATDSVGESIKESVTGKYTDKTTWYIIGGAASTLAGAAMLFVGGRNPLRS